MPRSPTSVVSRCSPIRCAGRWPGSGSVPTSLCSTRPAPGAGREVIDLLAAAEVPRIVHIGCEAASFARDIGLYRGHGYVVDELRVFDSFPLTHHVECVAALRRS